MVAIGIDLGTTYSCVGVVINGKVEILKNKEGEFTTPSCVYYTKNGCLVGKPAKLNLEVDPKNTLFNIKRVIGLESTDLALKSEKGYLPYEIVQQNGDVKIKVTVDDKDKYLVPEEVSGKVLAEMKRIAEKFLGKEVVDAVITVPARFNNTQKDKTIEAARYAGLNVLRLLHEPTAAAIAFGQQNQDKRNGRKVLVYDLGGGTFDVSILTMDEGEFDVSVTSGDPHLGGEDFDQTMLAECLTDLAGRGVKVDDIKTKYRLRRACEQTKLALSVNYQDMLSVDNIGPERFSKHFRRAKFERINKHLFDRTMESVEKALREAKLRKDQIDDIVVVGGSSRIPYVEMMLKKFFEKDVCTSLHPDRAVAIGAALFAAKDSLNADPSMHNFSIRDVIPKSLGVDADEGNMSIVLRKNTKYPVKQFGNYSTLHDNQTVVTFKVYEGESARTCLNTFLGSFTLKNIPPQKAGVPSFDVSFDINNDGILTVSAVDRGTGNANRIAIEWNKRSQRTSRSRYQIEIQRTLYKSNEDAELVMSARYELETAIYDLPDKLRTVLKRYEELRDGTMHISNLQPDVVRSIQKDIDDIPKMLKDACQVIKKGLSIHMIGQQENKHMVSKGKAEKKREKSSNNVAMAEKSKLKVSILELSNKLRTVLKKYEELEEYTSVISNLQLDDVRSIKDVVDRTLEDLCVIQQRIKVQLCNGVLGRDNGERSMQSEVSKNGSSSDVNTVGKRGSVGDHKVKLSQGSSSKRSDFEERSMQPDVSEIHLSNSISAVERDEPTEDNYRKSSKHSAIRHQDYDEIMAKEAAGLRSMSDNRHAATPPYAADIYNHTHPLHKSSPSERYHHQTNLPHCALDPINYRTQGGFTPQFTDPTTLTTSSHFHHTDPIESQPKSYRPMAGGRTHVHGSPHLGDQFQTYPSTCVDFHGTPSFPSSSPGHQQPGYDDFTHPNTTHHRAEGTKGSKSKGPSRGSSTRRY